MRILISITVALLLAACASQKPIIDPQGIDMVKYERDLAQCQSVADQVDTGSQVGKSAAAGALYGGAIGAVFGEVGEGAAAGAISGGAQGGFNADHEKAYVVRNCLRHRGYVVLN